MALVLPILRADLRMIERWVSPAEPPLAVPITALGGSADPRVPADELAGWRAGTTGRFATQVFAGDHFYLNGGRRAVTSAIRDALSAPPRA
jgi:surfactin synthase thioesterase subunit